MRLPREKPGIQPKSSLLESTNVSSKKSCRIRSTLLCTPIYRSCSFMHAGENTWPGPAWLAYQASLNDISWRRPVTCIARLKS